MSRQMIRPDNRLHCRALLQAASDLSTLYRCPETLGIKTYGETTVRLVSLRRLVLVSF